MKTECENPVGCLLLILLALIVGAAAFAGSRLFARQPEEPADNELSPEKIALGRELFNDPIMSLNGTVSCASCHQPAKGFTDDGPVSVGIGGQLGQIRAPTLVNVAFQKEHFWNGRASQLEGQVSQPILGAVELGNTNLNQPAARLANIFAYREEFYKVFGHDLAAQDNSGGPVFRNGQVVLSSTAVADMLQAIAAYERGSLTLPTDTPAHKHLDGVPGAFNAQQNRGWKTFEAHCIVCHEPPDFTDRLYHNQGIEAQFNRSGTFNNGRFDVTKQNRDGRAFKTPTLLEVQRRGNYFHTGSAPTLEAAVDYLNEPATNEPLLDPQTHALGLSEGEKADLVYLLKTAFASPSYPKKFIPPTLPRDPQ